MGAYFIDDSEDGYGKVFVPRGPWQPGYTDLVGKEHIPVVRLSAAMGWRGTDLHFLRELSNLRGVEIYAPEVRDASVIASLHGLQLVGLDCDLRTPIDFGELQELEVVKARWTGAIRSLLHSSGLKHLNLSNWPGDDLESLGSMSRLTKLQLTSRKLRSLRGIDALKSLEWLDLHACPKLTSLEGIRCCRSITHLEVTSCKAVHEISEIGELGALRELHLDDSGELESLEPVRGCQLLEKLSFFGTTRILDGKISALEDLPRLKTVRFAPRRHYDRTRDAIVQGK